MYMFYRGEFVLTKKGRITNGKFYLYNPNYEATSEEGGEEQQQGGGEGSRGTLRFVIEDATGINDVRSKMADVRSDYYTLDGRKLNGRPTKAGLYIKNGRKTIINRK